MIQKHWTPRYIVDRTRHFLFEKRHKNLPWITPDAIKILNELLSKTDKGLEFGSGRSTAWYAERVQHLTSVEDHQEWFNTVQKQFQDLGLKNVDYLFKSAEGAATVATDYCKVMHDFDKESLDFIVVDGKHRDVLALAAIEKIKPGGFILLDDVHRYLPRKTKSPHALGTDASKMSPEWKTFKEEIQYWRTIWTTNGVTDTAIFIKK